MGSAGTSILEAGFPFPFGAAAQNPSNAAGQAAAQDVSKRLDALEKRLESTPRAAELENRAADLQKLLAALVTVGTIFGLALGVGTYVNLKDIQEKAEKQLDEIRADFPAISRLNHKIAVILEELREYGNLRLEELDEDSYSEGTSPEEKEEILLREMAFNALTFFDYGKVDALQGSATEAFVTFGHCYGARYLSDQDLHADAFHRSVIYLNRALENGKPEVAPRVRSALGILYIWQSTKESGARKKDLIVQARQHLGAVLAVNELDPRCLIGAAWIDRRENRLIEAIERLDKLIKAATDKKLAAPQVKRFLGKAYFNRACYLALDGKPDEAMKDLRDSRVAAQKYLTLEKWVKELQKEADLATLQANFQEELTRMQDLGYSPPSS